MAERFEIGKQYINNNRLVNIYECVFVSRTGVALLEFVSKHPKCKETWETPTEPVTSQVPQCWDQYIPEKKPLGGTIFVVQREYGGLYYSDVFIPMPGRRIVATVEWEEETTIDKDEDLI